MPHLFAFLCFFLLLAEDLCAHQEGERWPKPTEVLRLGPLTLDVHVSPTAQRFHLVDQLSAWDNACHGQYRESMQLSAQDEEVLKRYAAMRSQRRWGHYREYLPRARAGDLLVLLVAADHPERVPASFAALSPLDPAALERELARGGTLTEEHTTDAGLRVLLLAAPTVRELEELVAATPALR
jgi:hypothetical protein